MQEISWPEESWITKIWRKRLSPGEILLGPQREGSQRKKLDSGRVCQLSKLEDQIPSHGLDENEHQLVEVGGTVHACIKSGL